MDVVHVVVSDGVIVVLVERRALGSFQAAVVPGHSRWRLGQRNDTTAALIGVFA